jgi:hypothetical protein
MPSLPNNSCRSWKPEILERTWSSSTWIQILDTQKTPKLKSLSIVKSRWWALIWLSTFVSALWTVRYNAIFQRTRWKEATTIAGFYCNAFKQKWLSLYYEPVQLWYLSKGPRLSPRSLLELLLVIGILLLFASEDVEPRFCRLMFSSTSTKETSIEVHGWQDVNEMMSSKCNAFELVLSRRVFVNRMVVHRRSQVVTMVRI